MTGNIWRGKVREHELVGDGARSPWSGVPARQRPGHGRCSHRRPMETPPGGSPHSSSLVFTFPLLPLNKGKKKRKLMTKSRVPVVVVLWLILATISAYQDAVLELSEHGVVLIVEETCCLQAKVYLQREVPDFLLILIFFLFCLPIIYRLFNWAFLNFSW